MFKMKGLKEFEISFTGLKLGKHQFSYQLDNKFFDFFGFQDFEKSDIHVVVKFEKKNSMFNLEFISKGVVVVPCDMTAESFELEVEGSLFLIVKFGNEYNDDNDEILFIPHNSYQLDVSQFIYEMIVLSLPSKRIHPGIVDGTLKSEVLDRLRKFENKELEENAVIDPRWAKLKELKTNK
jgi:uncharacterized metal-binding protein YceD (DUF177 family)